MSGIILLLTAIGILGVKYSEAVPVYGFNGASSTLISGRTLHYTVQLEDCQKLDGDDPEFAETFGGHVTIWQSINDREIADEPFLVFFDQTVLFDAKGKLAQLVREVEVWANDSAIVRSVVYTVDYSIVQSVESHRCTLAAQNKTGNINFQASNAEPSRLHSFDEVMKALEAGSDVRFHALSFLCMGGREHAFSVFGGRISNYETRVEDIAVKYIKSSVQQTVHYDVRADMHVLDVINVNIYDNRTAEIIDTRGRPLYQDLVHVHTSFCFIDAGAPGGSFTVFSNDM